MSSKKWMLVAVVSFCIMAVSIKEISNQIDPFQIIFYRSLIGLIITLIFFKKKLTRSTFLKLKQHLFRNIFHLIGQFGWIVGVMYLSLAEVTAIEFSVPIWVLILAFLLLKEKITRKKILSILFGFAGVLIIIKPGVEIINSNSLIVLFSAISYAVTHTSTKKLIQTSSALEIVFLMGLIQTPLSFGFALSNWNLPTLNNRFWLIIVGSVAIIAHFSMAKAMKEEDLGSIISLDYLRLPILLLVGIVVYNEEFQSELLIGGTLIFVGNLIKNQKALS